MAAARQKAIFEALTAEATRVKETAAKGLAEGQTFRDSLAKLDVKVEAAEPFTGLSGSSSTNEAVQALVQSVVAYNPGEVTDPLPSGDGVIVAYLKARTPADEASFDSYREEISNVIRNRRAQGLFRDWQTSLLAPEHFTDLQSPVPTDDVEEDGDGEPVPTEQEQI